MFSAAFESRRDHFLYALQHHAGLLHPRPTDSHKGTFGTLAVLGGASGMSGAVVLAATAALYGGCGKVWASFRQPDLPMSMLPQRPEIMLATTDTLLERNDIDAWVCGCGLGLDDLSAACLSRVLQTAAQRPLLLDADALTLMARHPDLAAAAVRHGQTVLTPHPAEAARLLGCQTADIQADRRAAVQTLATRFQAVTILKGHNSLIAVPDGQLTTNPSGNPGLATAGSGDVLSGLIGSMLAQGTGIAHATAFGVWLHGAAADLLAAQQGGNCGLLSGELPPAVRWLHNRLISYAAEQ